MSSPPGIQPLDARAGSGRRRKASERVAAALVAHVVDNDLPEGARLPSEKEMVEEFKVSRATLREGLRLLESRGALTIRAGRQGGPIVRRPRAADLGESIALLLQFEGGSLADVLVARKTLEPVLAELATDHVTERDVRLLRRTITVMREEPSEDVFHEQNKRFHELITERSGNSLLRTFVGSLAWLADGTQVGVSYSERQIRAIADAHERVVVAMEANDATAAGLAMRSHLDEADGYWMDYFRDVVTGPIRWLER